MHGDYKDSEKKFRININRVQQALFIHRTSFDLHLLVSFRNFKIEQLKLLGAKTCLQRLQIYQKLKK